MRFFSLLLAVLVLTGAEAYAATKRPEIAMRWYTETGEQGLSNTQAFPVKIGRRTKMLKSPPVVTETDILGANFTPLANGTYRATLTLSRAAGVALSLATRANQGRDLVVLYNNRPLYVAKIDTVIEDGVFVVPQGIFPPMKALMEEMVTYNRRTRKLDE
ncbi:MAG: hypothetical protein AAGK14_00805 [Verrucomicrobiota bacterium]